jgi:NADH-quinone oxidoreductase subunit M
VIASKHGFMKAAALLASGLTVAAVAGGVIQGSDPTATALMWLLSVTAVAAILGQQAVRSAALSLPAILIALALSLGALAGGRPWDRLFLGGLMATVTLLLVRHRPDALAWGAVAGWAIGILALAGSFLAFGFPADVWRVIACAVLLPLFPVHGAFIGALSRLPGSLPAFLAVALPALGWHALTPLAESGSLPASGIILALALVGTLYEALRVSVQFHWPRMTAGLTTILLSLAWWQIGAGGAAAPETAWYLGAVSLAASGLLLAGHQLEARYGVLDLDKLRGLAGPMPRLSLLVALLLMAAMGLPLFGVFPTFMAMMLAVSHASPFTLAAMLAIWLTASLLLMKLLQRLLFGEPKPDLPYHDLTWTEVAPLVLVLVLWLLAWTAQVPATHPVPPVVQAQAASGERVEP